MPKVIVTHDVDDVAAWLGYAAERAEAIAGLGATNVVDHVASDGSTSVAVAVEVADVEAFAAALASPSPEVGEVMQRHGVRPPLTLYAQR